MALPQIAEESAFAFLRLNERQQKPHSEGIAGIRGPYYTPLGRIPSVDRSGGSLHRLGKTTNTEQESNRGDNDCHCS